MHIQGQVSVKLRKILALSDQRLLRLHLHPRGAATVSSFHRTCSLRLRPAARAQYAMHSQRCNPQPVAAADMNILGAAE